MAHRRDLHNLARGKQLMREAVGTIANNNE